MNSVKIGKFNIKKMIVPGPMCGIMDAPFRKIIAKFGSPVLYTEMIASHAFTIDDKKEYITKSIKKDSNIPFIVQIAGCNPEIMAHASQVAEGLGADIIDMNFGCPVKKVTNGYAGSALMRDEKLSADIINAVVKSVKIPVTIKMRMGWDINSLNADNISKIAQDAGVQSITIHCRTRNQMYKGSADWGFVKNHIKPKIQIPIIVNGDIIDLQSVQKALQESDADGVMVSRGMYGKPWLVKSIIDNINGITSNDLSTNPWESYIEEHIDEMLNFYDQHANGFIIKHLYFYSKNIEGSSEFRKNIAQSSDVKQIKLHAKSFFTNLNT